MSRAPLRSLCVQALNEWDQKSLFAESIIDRLARRHELDERDRAFLNEVVLGVLRNLLLIDHRIARLRKGKLRPGTRSLLQVGLYQIFHMRVPDHAAVSETVSLARNARERGLVNAVLRRATREKEEMRSKEASLPLCIRYSIPEFLIDRWTARFGNEAARSLCDWINLPAPVYFRANLLQPDAAEIVPASASPLASDVRFFRAEKIPREWIEQGLVYVQDPSTAMACDLLDPAPETTVLDACAAPGGKTSLLAEKMGSTGRILACDSNKRRLARLEENLERLKIRNTDTALIDWSAPLDENHASLPLEFDAILIDAPCTNTGVMRRRIDLRWRLHERSFDEMARLQFDIANHCIPRLRKGGKLVYSTCSLETEENREVVERLLSAHPDLKLIETRESLPFRDTVDGAYAALMIREPSAEGAP